MADNSDASTILVMAKIGAMIGLGCGSMTLGMLPLIVGRCRRARHAKRPRGISSNSSASTATATSTSSIETTTVSTDSQGLPTSLLLCFGGGVLLFTTFLHLAPEVRASVERHQSNGQLPSFGTLSLAELLFCGGFFLVYLVEEAVHAALTGKPESSEALLYRTVSVRRCNNQTGVASATSSLPGHGSTTTVSTTTRSTWKDDCDLVHGLKDEEVLPGIFVLSSPTGARNSTTTPFDLETDIEQRRSPGQAEYQQQQRRQQQAQSGNPSLKKKSSIQGLLTVLALSFHAIFEGLAVGLEPAIGSVVYLAAAIATHKLVISFCVGMELYVAGASSRTTLGYLTVFSLVTPIGIAVGLALGHFNNDSDTLGPAPTILQGMAAGTLLYVVFFEVLARERANEKSGLLQLAAILLGFMLMLSLQIFTAHSHAHGADDAGHGGHGHSHGTGHSHVHDHRGMPGQSRPSNGTVLDGAIDAIDKVTENIAEAVTAVLTQESSPSGRDETQPYRRFQRNASPP